MPAKVVFQKYKLNIIFHCLQDWVKTSEFNTDHVLFGCCFLFPISTPHPVFQADEVLTILYSTFIFNGLVPFPTVPTVWNVLTPTYLSVKLFLILQGHFGNHSSLISHLLLDCFCLHYRSYSFLNVVHTHPPLTLLAAIFIKVCSLRSLQQRITQSNSSWNELIWANLNIKLKSRSHRQM